MKCFIDASAYLSLLVSSDNNHESAIKWSRRLANHQYITSQAVLGEVLTVGSQRFDKTTTVYFVEEILKSTTLVVLEKQHLVKTAWKFFKKVKSKNISWVDCYSQAIIEELIIDEVFTFDKDFKKLKNLIKKD